MAAVAAEPGPAVQPPTTTSGDEAEPEPEHAAANAKLEVESTKNCAPAMDIVYLPQDGEATLTLLHTEKQDRPNPDAASSPYATVTEHIEAAFPGASEMETAPEEHEFRHLWCELKTDFLPSVEATNEVNSNELHTYPQPISSSLPKPSAVFLQSHSAHHLVMETGLTSALLSLIEPSETLSKCVFLPQPHLTESSEMERQVRSIIRPSSLETEPEPEQIDYVSPEFEDKSPNYAAASCPEALVKTESFSVLEENELLGCTEEKSDGYSINTFPIDSNDPHIRLVGQVPAVSKSLDMHTAQQIFDEDSQETKPDSKLAVPCAESVSNLIPGSEVRVSLDHVIDDTLVVSFRLGDKIFSGVLMELSKRFGPYGIPVTVFPKREYRNKYESMQLTKTKPFQTEAQDISPQEPVQTPVLPNFSPNPWSSKPPPLFQEGVPYPPPLFIRDTYNQSIPQPLPRKIKRPKRRLYREEPTSIMSGIKLRPRQVLCDKCKGAVVGDKRDARKDSQGEGAKRRRGERVAAVCKRPRADPRPAVRVPHSGGQVKVKGPVSRVLSRPSAPAPSPASCSQVQLNGKKVLRGKCIDQSKVNEVLKLAKAQRRQRGAASGNIGATTSRISTILDAQQKVHFTRRLHQVSRNGRGGQGSVNPLPPRIRIKPQRYRNEETNSPTCKPKGLQNGQECDSIDLPKPALPRCISTRSSSSSTSAAGEAMAPELKCRHHNQSHSEPEPSPQPMTLKEHSDLEAEPEPEQLDGQEEEYERHGSKAVNLAIFMTHEPRQLDSFKASLCSIDIADDLKSSNSECSSTETLDFPPPAVLPSLPIHGAASASTATAVSSSKQRRKRGKSLKVFSKNVSKCIAIEGRALCVGDIVWAKIYGFPWWPARILAITVSRRDNGHLVRQEARVAWFGSPTTSSVALSQLAPFLENFQTRFNKKRKGPYRRAITEAAKAAKQLTPEVRALLTQFET